VNSTVRLLTLVAVALAGLVVIELTISSGTDPETVAAPDTAAPETAAAQPGSESPSDYANTILARPLFRPDRHPFPTNDQDALATAPVDLPRLTGILLSSDVKRAIFAPEGSDQSIVVAEGETVGDWRVQEIAADSVTMVGPDGTRRLRPKFAANLVPATPGGVDAPAPAPEPAPPAPSGPLPQLPKRGAAMMNARRHQHDNMRPPPSPPQRKH
jgi:general secretion pathway protein N